MSKGSDAKIPLPEDTPFEVGTVIGGKYRLDNLIAQGGMGRVYDAIHLATGKRAAIKMLLHDPDENPKGRERLFREARTAGGLHHPNIVDIYDVGEHDGAPYLVMERLYGETLSDRLLRGLLSPTEAIRLLIPAMRGVAAAHAQGVVHRDVKPDNIFLCLSPKGRVRSVKVLDFGISKAQRDLRQLESNLTRSGTIIGTPGYMAPEQLAGEAIGPFSDLYSFAVILFEAVAGRLPFDGDTFALMASHKLTKAPLPLRRYANVDRGLSKALQKALDRDPKKRFASLAEFGKALEPYGSDIEYETSFAAVTTAPPDATQVLAAATPPHHLTVPLIAIGVAITALIIGSSVGLYVVLSDDGPERQRKSPSLELPLPPPEEGLRQPRTATDLRTLTDRQAASDEAASDEAASNQAATNEAASNQAATNEAASNEAASNQAAPNQALSNNALLDEAVPDEAVPDEAVPEQSRQEPTARENALPGEPTASESPNGDPETAPTEQAASRDTQTTRAISPRRGSATPRRPRRPGRTGRIRLDDF
ncbi:MAG: protein kinase [Myxococcota bacterium]